MRRIAVPFVLSLALAACSSPAPSSSADAPPGETSDAVQNAGTDAMKTTGPKLTKLGELDSIEVEAATPGQAGTDGANKLFVIDKGGAMHVVDIATRTDGASTVPYNGGGQNYVVSASNQVMSCYFGARSATYAAAGGLGYPTAVTGLADCLTATPIAGTTLVAVTTDTMLNNTKEVDLYDAASGFAAAGSIATTNALGPLPVVADAKWIVASTNNNAFEILDTAARNDTGSVAGFGAAALSPDDSALYVLWVDSSVDVIDPSTRKVTNTFPSSSTMNTAANGIAVTTDGKWLLRTMLVGASSQAVEVLSSADGSVVSTADAPPIRGYDTPIVIAADGTIIVYSVGGAIFFYSLNP